MVFFVYKISEAPSSVTLGKIAERFREKAGEAQRRSDFVRAFAVIVILSAFNFHRQAVERKAGSTPRVRLRYQSELFAGNARVHTLIAMDFVHDKTDRVAILRRKRAEARGKRRVISDHFVIGKRSSVYSADMHTGLQFLRHLVEIKSRIAGERRYFISFIIGVRLDARIFKRAFARFPE